MDNQNKSKFGLGMLIGAVTGAVAAIFLTPKTGKEARDLAIKKYQDFETYLKANEVDVKLKAIFDEVSTDAKEAYAEVTKELAAQLKTLQEKVGEIEKDAYLDKMEEAISKSRLQKLFPEEVVAKMRSFLTDSFEILKDKKGKS